MASFARYSSRSSLLIMFVLWLAVSFPVLVAHSLSLFVVAYTNGRLSATLLTEFFWRKADTIELEGVIDFGENDMRLGNTLKSDPRLG